MHNTPHLTIEQIFNQEFDDQKTLLKGGFEEPYYVPWGGVNPAEIQYREDYLRSALHEVAHWCIAGRMRRMLEDFGYWYRPDGRSAEEQKAFYHVEIKPQAIEKGFCEAIGIPFSVSCDNLSGDCGTEQDVKEFIANVNAQFKKYQVEGFPPRAARFIKALKDNAESFGTHREQF